MIITTCSYHGSSPKGSLCGTSERIGVCHPEHADGRVPRDAWRQPFNRSNGSNRKSKARSARGACGQAPQLYQ
jgi:hypothetical protein